ncbi:MAG: DNA polymerase domain-containing protein [Haloplanus sp.]
MNQADLSQFSGDDRPEAEAVAVAGDAGQSVAEVVDTAELQFPDADDTVDLAVTQVDYTVEGQGADEYPVVHLFGRTSDGTAEHVRVLGFEPYFYAPTESLDEDDLDRDVITRTETGYESIRGEELTKICTRTPRDVGQIRDEFDHYEADILFPNRLLIDKDIGSGVRVPDRRLESGAIQIPHDEIEPVEAEADLRVNTFDIEVDDRSGFPEDGEESIICLTSHDSYRDEYVAWLYDPDTEATPPGSLDSYDPFGEDFDADVRVFETEEAMLDAYVDYIESETDPDVITGWNCLPGDTSILLADGTEREIKDVQVGDAVVGNEGQETTVGEVTNKWESEKPILEFDLSDGTSLRSSTEHRIMVGDDDHVDWKEAGDIEPGEYVLKPRKLTVEDETVPNLSDLVPLENQRFEDRDSVTSFKASLPDGAITDLADRFDLATGTLYHPRTDVWTPRRCSIAADEFDVPLPDGGRTYRRTRVDLDRQLTEREAYLAGLVLTDGTMSPEDGIRFYNTREELHDQFPGDNELRPDGTGCYAQDVLDYALLYAFEGLGIPFGDKNDGPVDLSAVYELPEDYIARFLAGVIDGDGNVSDSVTVAAENRSIGRWYAKLFRRLGVYALQRGNVVRVPDAERDIERLQRTVLPHMCHSEKTRALSNLGGGKSGRTEDIPYALFEADPGSEERRIARDKHRRDIAIKRHETTAEEWEEYVFVAVESVETVGTETTYDIETTTHNFIAEDCLVHNCDDFDAPYLIDRLEVLDPRTDRDLDPDRLSRIGEVWRSDWGGPTIKGRVVFDLLYAYKRTQFTELESYRLDAVGEQELGAGKERYAGDIGDLWEDDPQRLLEYNLRDVELCVELDRKRDIISFWDEVRTFVGCKLEDAPTPGDAVDVYVLHKVHGDFALPSKGQAEAEDYEGGAVFEPITGVKENVSVLDLKCFSGDTAVLTPDGERNITDLKVGDPIYTLNPDTFECEIKPVEETHRYENAFGELHHLSGNTHDLKITENHRLLYADERGWDDQRPADFTVDEFRDIPAYERYAFPQHEPMAGRSPETFALIDEVDEGYAVVYSDDDLRSFRAAMPDDVTDALTLVHGSSATMGVQKAVGKYLVPVAVYREHRSVVDRHADDVFLKYGKQHRETPLTFDMTDWLELLGWFVTEGSVDRAAGRITIHQSGSAEREAIRELFDRMGINYNADEHGVNVSNRYLLEWLADNCGDGYADKRLPSWVFDLDADLLSVLLDTMIRGDGSRTDSGLGKFWTKSDDLKDAITDIAVRCGHKPTVSEQSDGTWYVSVGKRGSFKKSTNATVEDHDGDVYCVTAADNHVILAGRNGNYQWIGQSLYPMCMVTINASPETKVDPEAYDDTYHAPNGTHFQKKPDGVIREMVDELLDEREQKKARRDEYDPDSQEYEQYDRQQAAVKVIMNSLYGVLGWDRFRLYDREMGAAVTATGREVIEHTQSAANDVGYEVAYGDTDSVMLEIGDEAAVDEVPPEIREAHPDASEADLRQIAGAIETGYELEDRINDSYDVFAAERLNADEHRFQIEFEKLYRRFFQAGKKKRYAGHIVWKEGKHVDDIDITGFEYKRSDIAPITKEVQRQVIEMIVTGTDVDAIEEYIHDVIEDYEAGNVDLDDVGIPGGIGKRLTAYDTDTAQVRGAKYANLLLGTNFQRGSKPKRLYLKKVHPDFFRRLEEEEGFDPQADDLYAEFKRDPDVICFEYADQIPDAFEVDWDKMLEKTLQGPIARIIEALGLSWDEVKSGQRQTGLGRF